MVMKIAFAGLEELWSSEATPVHNSGTFNSIPVDFCPQEDLAAQ
jgi:hypothetical protein